MGKSSPYVLSRAQLKIYEVNSKPSQKEFHPDSKLRISCQYKPTRNITEMFLFDLQTVGFSVLKKARCIAAIERCQERGSASFLWVVDFTNL